MSEQTGNVYGIRRDGDRYYIQVAGGPRDTRAGHDHLRRPVWRQVSVHDVLWHLLEAQLNGNDGPAVRPTPDKFECQFYRGQRMDELQREYDETIDAFLAGTGRR